MSTHKMTEEQKRMAEELLFSGEQSIGFAKQMFFGRFNHQKAMPYSRLKDDEEDRFMSFMNILQCFLQEELDPVAIDQNKEIPREIILRLGEIGVLGMTVPREYGGQGFSQHAFCKAIEEINAVCGSTTVFVNAHHSVGLRAVLLYGSEEQKKQWLPGMCSGEKIVAFALTEEHAGSDVSNIQSEAVYDAERDIYILNGSKRYITNGGIADILTIMAKTDVETEQGIKKRVSAFLVTPDMPGFTVIEKAMDKVGIRGTMTGKLEFHNIEIPAANLIGKKGAGLSIPLNILNFGRVTFGAACTGAAKYCVKRAAEYASRRIQFQRPLASFEMVKLKIARMAAYTYAMDAGTYLTASMFDRGEKDFMLEAAMVKVFGAEALWETVNETIQIFGGKAFFTDEPFERMMRDARLNSIGEGANEILRNFIGLVGMREVGLHLKEVTDKAKSFLSFASFLKDSIETLGSMISAPKIDIHCDELKDEIHELRHYYKTFHWDVTKQLAKYKEDIVDVQLPVNRIAEIAMALYNCSAIIIKYDNDSKQGKLTAEELTRDLACARLYFKEAFATIERCSSEFKENFDEDYNKLSDLITGI